MVGFDSNLQTKGEISYPGCRISTTGEQHINCGMKVQ